MSVWSEISMMVRDIPSDLIAAESEVEAVAGF